MDNGCDDCNCLVRSELVGSRTQPEQEQELGAFLLMDSTRDHRKSGAPKVDLTGVELGGGSALQLNWISVVMTTSSFLVVQCIV